MRNDSLEGEVSSLQKENTALRQEADVNLHRIDTLKTERDNLASKVEKLERLIIEMPELLADAFRLIMAEAKSESELRETLEICLKNLENRPDFLKEMKRINSPLELSLWLKNYQQNPA